MGVFDYSGQWTGFSNGDPDGVVVMDLDPVAAGSVGFVHLYSPDATAMPSALVDLTIKTSHRKFTLTAFPKPFDARFGYILNQQELASHFSSVKFPTAVHINIERISKDFVRIDWRSNVGTFGTANLERTIMPQRSSFPADQRVKNWDDFKTEVSKLDFRRFIFRGQTKPYPLQTTFHRSRRKVLKFYLDNDIQVLHRSIQGRTRHVFNLDRPQELGALLNLAQHHGFPTPLLDWTYSPFVAAWFAYQNIVDGRKSEEKVRVYALDRPAIMALNQFQNVTFAYPHTSILEALPIENDRAIPQQGLLMLTNMQDVERHISGLERLTGKKLMKAFDLPASNAKRAVNDLAMMGLTRSTLMPGIESICLDLKSRLFLN